MGSSPATKSDSRPEVFGSPAWYASRARPRTSSWTGRRGCRVSSGSPIAVDVSAVASALYPSCTWAQICFYRPAFCPPAQLQQKENSDSARRVCVTCVFSECSSRLFLNLSLTFDSYIQNVLILEWFLRQSMASHCLIRPESRAFAFSRNVGNAKYKIYLGVKFKKNQFLKQHCEVIAKYQEKFNYISIYLLRYIYRKFYEEFSE